MKYFYINNIKFNYTTEFNSDLKKNSWKQNSPLIDYCESIGINIPHYCYHKNLSISGNCRMCLIELKNASKPIVSCSMSAKSSLKNAEIFTNSPLTKKARENILEFLLLNHPLDCPICDQGGECDLQDQSIFFGMNKKRFYNFKRIVKNKNLGPIVKTVMTRCIHCTRCVRFAKEIAGVEELGMFGRGLSSEIGTYVTKTFQSELSGNIIDLCPVGALTSKPYPFLSRNWELKNINSIDFCDGFLTNIKVYLKNNKIIKILPGFNENLNTTNWISDKTRFSFDGMFSPERFLKSFIIKNNKQINANWNQIFKEILYFLYFQDHLNNHRIKINYFIIIFNSNISIELLSLLNFFEKKYHFIKTRHIEFNNNKNIYTEPQFIINSSISKLNLLYSDICVLIGINTRYEGPLLNLKLRQRYLKGNFKILSLSSFIDLTFPINYIGLNTKLINDITSGNNIFCQELITNNKPNIIINSELLKRTDQSNFYKIIELLGSKINKYHNQLQNNIHTLNNSLNETGINYINNYKKIKYNDLKKITGLYFININNLTSNIKKLIELKTLKFFFMEKIGILMLEQNNGFISDYFKDMKLNFNISTYINIPNKTFFESNNLYINTEGILKKNIKFLTTNKQNKEDWQILRKILTNSTNINFLSSKKNNFKLFFNSKNNKTFKKYLKFKYYSLTNFNFLTIKNNFNYFQSFKLLKKNTTYKNMKYKIYKTNLRLWIDNFYIGGKDSYSKHSITMLKCSKLYKKEKTNFNFM